MIQGYPSSASIFAGQLLQLHVSTTYKRFAVEFFVQQTRLEKVLTLEFISRGCVAPGPSAADWDWPAYPVLIPDSWVSGVYLARLRCATHAEEDPSHASEVLFVVRARQARSKIIFKLPVATYHAYNASGGGNLYRTPAFSGERMGRTVSLRRPGGGVAGILPVCRDFYKGDTVRHSFYHWDAPFIVWLTSHGYQMDFCTGLDLLQDPQTLEDYSLLIISAHDEYWCAQERKTVENFIEAGGNVAFFGANTCWWRIHYIQENTAFTCHKGDAGSAPAEQRWAPERDATPALDQWWTPTGAAQAEDRLTGVSYRNGGGWWEGPREQLGYVVQNDNHWVFENTGLRSGDCFGWDGSPPLIGYECDGVALQRFQLDGRAIVHENAFMRGTPDQLEVLGAARLNSEWQELPEREGECAGEGLHAATMVAYERNGKVFNAATVDWVTVLTRGHCRAVEQITRNVLQRFSR